MIHFIEKGQKEEILSFYNNLKCFLDDGLCYIDEVFFILKLYLLSPAAPKARDGRYCNAPRPSVCLSVRLSVCLSVTFSFRTVTQKRIAVFSRNFAGTCTKSWGCAV